MDWAELSGPTVLSHSKNSVLFHTVPLVGSADMDLPMHIGYGLGRTERTHGTVLLKNPVLFHTVPLVGSVDMVFF